MIFQAILNNAEPYALDLKNQPLRIFVRAQVIMGFVALGLGKGGLFISTFLYAMAWSEDGWLIYAVPFSLVTFLIMVAGYIITLGRIEARIEPESGLVHLTRRIPFHRHQASEPLGNYQGVSLSSQEQTDSRAAVHTLTLVHDNADLNVPLWRRRRDEPPTDEWAAYATALGVPRLT